MGDLNTILPMLDRVVRMKVPGRILRQALENAVSKYPTTAGRFVQVSGLNFSFQPDGEPRVQSVLINDEELDESRIYSGKVLKINQTRHHFVLRFTFRRVVVQRAVTIFPFAFSRNLQSLLSYKTRN